MTSKTDVFDAKCIMIIINVILMTLKYYKLTEALQYYKKTCCKGRNHRLIPSFCVTFELNLLS